MDADFYIRISQSRFLSKLSALAFSTNGTPRGTEQASPRVTTARLN